MALCTSMAQRTASTTLRNSTISAVARALDDPAVVDGDRRVDQVAAQRAEARQNPFLVGAGEPAVADDVGDQDRRNFPGFADEDCPCAASSRSPCFCTSPTKRIPLRAIVRISFCSSPLSPTALRAALTRLVRVESETIRPPQTDAIEIVLADHTVAVLDQVDQEVEHLRLNRNGLLTAAQLTAVGIQHMARKVKLHLARLTGRRSALKEPSSLSQ